MNLDAEVEYITDMEKVMSKESERSICYMDSELADQAFRHVCNQQFLFVYCF